MKCYYQDFGRNFSIHIIGWPTDRWDTVSRAVFLNFRRHAFDTMAFVEVV